MTKLIKSFTHPCDCLPTTHSEICLTHSRLAKEINRWPKGKESIRSYSLTNAPLRGGFVTFKAYRIDLLCQNHVFFPPFQNRTQQLWHAAHICRTHCLWMLCKEFSKLNFYDGLFLSRFPNDHSIELNGRFATKSCLNVLLRIVHLEQPFSVCCRKLIIAFIALLLNWLLCLIFDRKAMEKTARHCLYLVDR